VAALRQIVVDASVQDEIAGLRSPPGGSAWPNDGRRSEWFNSLSSEDQGMVAEIVRSSIFAAVFGFCCVLDGVRAFDDAHGSPVLTYVSPTGGQLVLNAPQGPELHVELRGDGPPP
jgi:hypothetical protein